MSPPIASVVIPAYNEGKTITRCLTTLLEGAEGGELEIVVVCNGCHDDTAERARAFLASNVFVLETKTASKSHALNLGDSHASHFPRVYLDADIQITIEVMRDLVKLLATNEEVLLSAPRAVVDFEASDPFVRAYYRVWTQLPYFREAMVGSGIYAFSERGRRRFGEFPKIIADDEYARRMVSPAERASSKGTFRISAPRTIQSLLAVNSRVRAGMYELETKFPELSENRGTSPSRTLLTIATQPSLWLDAPVYLGIMLAAKVLAHKKRLTRTESVWNRDDTARN